MPVPGFLTSFADKAQSALQSSPLGQHLPHSGNRPASPDNSPQPSANQAAGSGGSKNYALEAIHHQLRAFGQQYSSTTPTQRIITAGKGLALDVDSLSRDSKAHSKELYTWGQTEDDDIRDVSDRLAYFNFVSGSLSSTLATRLDGARAPFKTLRDAETSLAPRRTARTTLEAQIAKIEHDQQKGYEKRLVELKDQLRKAESDDAPQEKEIQLLKRKALKDSERVKWQAIREYAEKLVLISQAAELVIDALPTFPPTKESPYNGGTATGAARASLQRALDNYKTGHINLNPHPSGANLDRSDTRSFGETHAKELGAINTEHVGSNHPGIPVTPPLSGRPSADAAHGALRPHNSPPPINPSVLNNAPAPIPAAHAQSLPHEPSTTSPVPVSQESSASQVPGITPTVAETGVPVSGGPGPASGSLHDIKGASPLAGPRSGGKPGNDSPLPSFGQSSGVGGAHFESAEDEKARLAREDRERVLATAGNVPLDSTQSSSRHETAQEEKARLAREDRERVLATGGSVPPEPSHSGSRHETAQEEKDRLQREERERVLAGESSAAANAAKRDGEDLPPYQEL